MISLGNRPIMVVGVRTIVVMMMHACRHGRACMRDFVDSPRRRRACQEQSGQREAQ
jgi:hypothetical protein